MNEVVVTQEDVIVMKLLHYFITEKGYNPIVLHGAQNEIWLENLDGNYEIIRIVSNYIHNNEQLDFDLYKTKQIVKRIKKKTFSFNMNTLSLFVNLGDNVKIDNYTHVGHIDCAKVKEVDDLKNYNFIIENYPNITDDTNFKEKGMNLFMKITGDITKKNEEVASKAEDVFSKKIPYITYLLIAINFIVFLLMSLLGNGSYDNETLINFGANVPKLIVEGDYTRLLTSAFIHIGIVHLVCNMYCLYVIGSQIESFLGRTKYLIIYLFSCITASLLSVIMHADSLTISAGASGTIFGLFGTLLYFGYHYRVYLGSVLKSQIIPLIILNLSLGFMLSGIDNAAHIGGLVGGTLMTMAVGIKYKSTYMDKVNGIILTIIFTSFLIFMAFVGI